MAASSRSFPQTLTGRGTFAVADPSARLFPMTFFSASGARPSRNHSVEFFQWSRKRKNGPFPYIFHFSPPGKNRIGSIRHPPPARGLGGGSPPPFTQKKEA